jgi:hypothetical protein
MLCVFAQQICPTQLSHFPEQTFESHADPTHGMGIGIDVQHIPLEFGTLGHGIEAPLLPEPVVAPPLLVPLPDAPLVAAPLEPPPPPSTS